jgi:hypothetical protein
LPSHVEIAAAVDDGKGQFSVLVEVEEGLSLTERVVDRRFREAVAGDDQEPDIFASAAVGLGPFFRGPCPLRRSS